MGVISGSAGFTGQVQRVGCMSVCARMHALHKFVFHRSICVFCGLVLVAQKDIKEWVLGVCVGVCHQKSMVAHLVVFRPGLRRQTAGDEKESSALQFRTFPTEQHLRQTDQDSLSV